MDTIKFANGVVFNCSFLATVPEGIAIIALDSVSFTDAAAIFSNQDMTREMQWGTYRLVGYTTLTALYVQPYGVQAVLSGGHDEIL